MILKALLLAAAASAADLPPLPGMSGDRIVPNTTLISTAAPAAIPAVTTTTVITEPAVSTAPVPAPQPAGLFPPPPPRRVKDSLDSAGEVARDLVMVVEYFEQGQAYYRAYTKGGSHTAAENAAFVRFLEEYEAQLAASKRVHQLLGIWLEKKSGVKD
jgi:hypothetical protein